jgi:ankyrin repeat protein
MNNIVVDELFTHYYKSKEYPCSRYTESKGFNKLMYLLVTFPNRTELLIKYIIDHPDEINEQNEEGWTPLMIVAKKSRKYDPQILKTLIACGAKLNIKTHSGKTALLLAVLFHLDSNLDTFKILLEAEGYYSKILIKLSSLNIQDRRPIKLLLRHGVNINNQDKNGFTALIMQCIYNSSLLIIIKTLLIHGANQYIKNGNNIAVFDYMVPNEYEQGFFSLELFKTHDPEL